jgi:hypothetical protein
VAPFAQRFLQPDEGQHERADQERLAPGREAERSRVEEDVNELQVHEAELQDEDRPYADIDPGVREQPILSGEPVSERHWNR